MNAIIFDLWKDPQSKDATFIPIRNKKYRPETPTEGYVFGNGTVGLGLYSLETKDAFVILRKRLLMRTRARMLRLIITREYEDIMVDKKHAKRVFHAFESLDMLAYVECLLEKPNRHTDMASFKQKRKLLLEEFGFPSKHDYYEKGSEIRMTHLCSQNPPFPPDLTKTCRKK